MFKMNNLCQLYWTPNTLWLPFGIFTALREALETTKETRVENRKTTVSTG
jgi:hypothetical protein